MGKGAGTAVSSWQLSFYVETGNRNRTGRLGRHVPSPFPAAIFNWAVPLKMAAESRLGTRLGETLLATMLLKQAAQY